MATNDQPSWTQVFVQKFLGRNYHLALFILTGCMIAMYLGKMSGHEYVELSLGIFASFRTGDAIVNWLHTRGGKDNQDSPQ